MGGFDGGARKKKRKKKMKRNTMKTEKHCAPGKGEGISCLDDELIMKIARSLNKLSKKKNHSFHISESLPIEQIYYLICEYLYNVSECTTEACWLTIDELMKSFSKSDKEKFKKSFKPMMPKEWENNPNEWLSTNDIENSLKQHMDHDKEFYCYGAVPMDFNKCSVSNLCSIDVNKHREKNQNKIGIVFNTDKSDKDGMHWLSMYIDILGKNLNGIPGIYYFDSYGKKPSPEVKGLIRKIQSQGNECGIEFSDFYNDFPYQKYDSQCGIFSINFIKEMLSGLSFEQYLNNNLSDEKMKSLRDHYFVRIDS